MQSKVSLKDIARKVGVSIALVSYVLNNKNENRINKEVAQRIRDAAKELNYRANQIAKSLKTSKSHTIGLIVFDISNPFSSSLARVIEDEADKSGYTVIFGSSDENAEKSRKLMDTFLDRQVDGFIIAPAEDTETQLRQLQSLGIPFVLVDRYFPGFETNYVALDNFSASYTAVRHLNDNGYTRTGMLTHKSSLFHLQERIRGYSTAVGEIYPGAPAGWLKELTFDNISTGVQKAIDELLQVSPRIDSLLFGSNNFSRHGLKYIHSLDLRIPEDLAIVSFDETESSDLFYAPLTYLRQPITEMGIRATNILLGCMQNNQKIVTENLQAELVIRASSAKARALAASH